MGEPERNNYWKGILNQINFSLHFLGFGFPKEKLFLAFPYYMRIPNLCSWWKNQTIHSRVMFGEMAKQQRCAPLSTSCLSGFEIIAHIRAWAWFVDLATAVHIMEWWPGDKGLLVCLLCLLFHLGLLVPGASVRNTEQGNDIQSVLCSETRYFYSFLGHNWNRVLMWNLP